MQWPASMYRILGKYMLLALESSNRNFYIYMPLTTYLNHDRPSPTILFRLSEHLSAQTENPIYHYISQLHITKDLLRSYRLLPMSLVVAKYVAFSAGDMASHLLLLRLESRLSHNLLIPV